MNFVSAELVGEAAELLQEACAHCGCVAILVNPADSTARRRDLRDMKCRDGADTGVEIRSSTPVLARNWMHPSPPWESGREAALSCGADPFFDSQRDATCSLAAHHAMPMHPRRVKYVVAGGLMSYGPTYRTRFVGPAVYVGRVLKGDKPADLPVLQSSKFELVINAEDRQDARPQLPDDAARAHRRGDRVNPFCCICVDRNWHEADIQVGAPHVRYQG